MSILLYIIYSMFVIVDGNIEYIINIGNYFWGLILFFLGTKYSFYWEFTKTQKCYFIDLPEILLLFLPISNILIIIIYIIEFILLYLYYRKIKNYLKFKKEAFDQYLNLSR